jgi:hypothetical protein
MKLVSGLVLALVLTGCAGGKMGKVDKEIDRSAIDKATPIYVEMVSAKDTTFSGDKAKDTTRLSDERYAIQNKYHVQIIEALKKRGYTAQVAKPGLKKGLVLSGAVTKFEHGSGAARMLVGMGAGSSNMFGEFKLEDRAQAKVLTKFEVIATSGGNSNSGSFMEAHLTDGAKKVAEYITGVK